MLIKMIRGKKLLLADGRRVLLLPELVYDVGPVLLAEQALKAGVEIHPSKVEKHGLEVHKLQLLEDKPKQKKAAKIAAHRRK